MLFLYAKCDLKCGDEITQAYTAPDLPYEERAEKLKRQWDIVCDCRLCQLDRADPEGEAERVRLLAQFEEERGYILFLFYAIYYFYLTVCLLLIFFIFIYI